MKVDLTIISKMPGFADSFWSADYAGGLAVLFGKLQQGITENQQILTIAKMRVDAEEIYSKKLGEIAPSTDKLTGGFARDDGASLRKVHSSMSHHELICTELNEF